MDVPTLHKLWGVMLCYGLDQQAFSLLTIVTSIEKNWNDREAKKLAQEAIETAEKRKYIVKSSSSRSTEYEINRGRVKNFSAVIKKYFDELPVQDAAKTWLQYLPTEMHTAEYFLEKLEAEEGRLGASQIKNILDWINHYLQCSRDFLNAYGDLLPAAIEKSLTQRHEADRERLNQAQAKFQPVKAG